MKHCLLLLHIVLLCYAVRAQEPRMSLSTMELLNAARSHKAVPSAVSAADVSDSSTTKMVSLFLTIDSSFNENSLQTIGGTITMRAGNLITITIPSEKVEALLGLTGVLFVNSGRRARKLLNIAAEDIGARAVWTGSDSTTARTGTGVVVGIIDWGFDLLHPTFSDGATTRIKRVWVQDGSETNGGSTPQPFNRGKEYTTPTAIAALACTNTTETHGTHTAGIAAGSGGRLGTYVGIAPQSDIVMVEVSANARDVDFIDGINYIFNYAQSVGMPAVVNISFGLHWGPHNGTSNFDKALDTITGAGRIVVGAAGNEGEKSIHASHTFTSQATRRIAIPAKDNQGGVCAILSPAKDFEWWVEVWHKTRRTKLYTYSTPLKSAEFGHLNNFSTSVSSTTITFNAQSYSASTTRYTPAYLEAEFTNSNPDLMVVFAFRTAASTLHVWNASGEALSNLSNASNADWLTPDNNYSIGELGCTARSIVCVGAYKVDDFCLAPDIANRRCTTGGSNYSLPQSERTLTTWSSRGPAVDGRTKPDIVAPGYYIVSAINSYSDPNYNYYPDSYREDDGRHYYHGSYGTSMAAPMAAGAAALLLEEDPALTPDIMLGLFRKYASLNELGSTVSSNYGYGKLRIPAALANISDRDLPTKVRILPSTDAAGTPFSIVPNPNNGTFNLHYDGGEAQLSVLSIAGTTIWNTATLPNTPLTLPPMPAGIYLIVLKVNGTTAAQKMALIQ